MNPALRSGTWTICHLDTGSWKLQCQIKHSRSGYRKRCPATLTSLISEMDFGFREEYLLGLILYEAVSMVVQHLMANRAASGTESEAPLNAIVSESHTCANTPSPSETAPDPPIEYAEATQPLLDATAQVYESGESPMNNRQGSVYKFPSQDEVQMQALPDQRLFDHSTSDLNFLLCSPPAKSECPT
jgi:hypothetical protein